MGKITQFIISFFTVVFLVHSVEANDIPQWQKIHEESRLLFEAKQNNSPVEGYFRRYETEIIFHPDHLDKSQIKVTIDMSSVESTYRNVTNELERSDWFAIDDFPKAEFISKKITLIKDQEYLCEGELTIRDKTVPVQLKFTLNKFTDSNAHVTGEVILMRLDYGVGQGEWSNDAIVANEVKVKFEIFANKQS